MDLPQAYRRLQWKPPLVFEREVGDRLLALADPPKAPRSIGTSSHMLLELYLDMYESSRGEGKDRNFLVVCLNAEHGKYLRDALAEIHRLIGFEVNLNRVRFWPHHRDKRHLDGDRWYSWAIFCDHSLKENLWPNLGRNTGFYRHVRRLDPTDFVAKDGGITWQALDRDGRILGLLTEKGKKEVVDMSSAPVTLGGPSPITYPAFDLHPEVLVRLRKAFEQ